MPVFFLIFFTLSAAASEKTSSVCPNVTITGKEDARALGFSENEKKLLCGDPDTAAWNKIPSNQVKFNITNFLQDRGYLHPDIKTEGDQVHVELGSKTKVVTFHYEGPDGMLDLSRKRKVIGEPLTPQLLGTVEAWATQKVESQGYACPKVITRANPDTGDLLIHVEPGQTYDLNQIIENPAGGLLPGVMRRYDAFHLGAPYNGDWVALTEDRVSGDQVLETTHFATHCTPEGVTLTQTSIAGLPRLFVIGAGVDTEGLVQGRISWRNSRIGDRGTWFDVTAMASTLEQSITATMHYYFLPEPSRLFLMPQFQTLHDTEEWFEITTQQVETLLEKTWDTQDAQLLLGAGPVYTLEHTFVGFGPINSGVFALETRATWMSHEYEFHAKDPVQGYTVTAVLDSSSQHVASVLSAEKLSLTGESLYNIRGYDPTLLIAGLRWGYSTTFTSERPGANSLIPQNFLQYLGGSQNLRGFGREELPGTGLGGLTSAFGSFELRLTHSLPVWMEPFLFDDIGAIGNGPLGFDSPLYDSPGFGIRLASPIGVFRATAAHGFAVGDTSLGVPIHFQFYVSYGEEF